LLKEKCSDKPTKSKQHPIGRDSTKKQKTLDVIIDSVKNSIPQNTQLPMKTNDI
jgi:hypothetical protein